MHFKQCLLLISYYATFDLSVRTQTFVEPDLFFSLSKLK